MYCGKCGTQLADGAENCPNCGEPAAPANNASSFVVKPRPTVKFAGFWLRLVALLIDSIVVAFVTLPLFWKPIEANLGPDVTAKSYIEFIGSGSRQAIAFNLLLQLCFWLYCAGLESSVWQATLGKKMLGLFVTDMQGKRISFARATGRYVGKALEQLTLFVGFLFAAFTAKKQALHDIVAGCLVLKKP